MPKTKKRKCQPNFRDSREVSKSDVNKATDDSFTIVSVTQDKTTRVVFSEAEAQDCESSVHTSFSNNCETVPKQMSSATHWRSEWSNGICPYCQNTFKGAQGVRVHIANSHPQQSQELKLSIREQKSKARRLINLDNTALGSNEVTSSTRTTRGNSSTTPEDPVPPLPSLDHWKSLFSDLLSRTPDQEITIEFESAVQEFTTFLKQSLQQLKGPQHPSTKFYRARRSGHKFKRHTKYAHSTNPQRSRKRRQTQANQQYQYELAQFRYHNLRKQAVKSVLNPKGKDSCKIAMDTLDAHFRSLLESPNDAIRDDYDQTVDPILDVTNETFSVQEIRDAMKGMSVDTSPGPDGVFMRVVKTLNCESVIALIASIMYQRSIVPSSFRSGRMVLVPKDGDPNQVCNWRPITIFSVLRRIIERVLDRRLRSQVQFSPSQRGFVNVPGTHVNASIINGVLTSAKEKEDDCVVVFLDVSKAFDNVGHKHLHHTLESLKIPHKLRSLICKLFEENNVRIHAEGKTSKLMRVLRGVPQGGPLSPSLFNLSVDFILRELSEESVVREYGYTLLENVAVIVALAFADDIALVAKDRDSAIRLVEIATRALNRIGLDVNMKKSKAIVLEKGRLIHVPTGLTLLDGTHIDTVSPSERVRYLGVDFENEIVFNAEGVLRDLKSKLDLLVNTTLLHPDQKLNIINQFIWPALIYPLQTAPLHKIKRWFLNDIDSLIRGAVKQICKIPMDTPDSMLYSAKKFRGLGVIRASWEAYLQHINIVQKLESVDDPALHCTRVFGDEIEDCLEKLKMKNHFQGSSQSNVPSIAPEEDIQEAVVNAKALRQTLRDREFQKWCSLPSKGKGVEVFKDYPPSNKWISEKCGLSYSEWTNALKMSTNGCNLRSNPRTASSTLRCRHCNEYETLAHVLGACPRGELLRNERHNRVCDILAADLRAKGCEVKREEHLVTDQGSRFADLVVIDTSSSQISGYILDPTVRFETSSDQADMVNEEKRAIYNPTLDVLKKKHPHVTNWQVFGLLFGARGALPKLTVEVLTKELYIQRSTLMNITISTIKDSVGILQHHIYSRERLD